MPLQLAVTIDFPEWLILTGKGQANNFSIPILAGSAAGVQTNAKLSAPVGFDLMLIYAIQFDGVLSGQITYQIVGTQGSVIAGYAVQAFIQDEILINDAGQPFQFQAISTQAQAAVMNIDYVAIPRQVWDRDVLPNLNAHMLGGR
jgi:hypothetical protein